MENFCPSSFPDEIDRARDSINDNCQLITSLTTSLVFYCTYLVSVPKIDFLCLW